MKAVETLVLSIRQSMTCTVMIRPILVKGLVGTSAFGKIETSSGYCLEIVKESLLFNAQGPVDVAFRYKFFKGGNQIMRIQTDKNCFPANARFPSQPHLHFHEPKWAPEHQRPNLLKMYGLFRQIVTAKGELPETFKSAEAGLIR